jgi:hypothetical protein
MIPDVRLFAIAESVERKMRTTNVDMKREFPEALVWEYASRHLESPSAAVVLGHFHVEKELHAGSTEGGGVFVLPEWKRSRRHLRVTSAGDIRFEDS